MEAALLDAPPTGTKLTVSMREYDAAGKKTKMVDRTGTTTYAYDDRGALTLTTPPHGKVVSVYYDAVGRRTKLDLTDYGATPYQYDDCGALTLMTLPGSKTVTYAYDSLHRATQQTYEGHEGQVLTFDFWVRFDQILPSLRCPKGWGGSKRPSLESPYGRKSLGK